jgi:hypothetical protein
MKTLVFIFIVCILISLSISAQTKPESKSDSAKNGSSSFQHTLNDTLKLDNPFVENNLQLPYLKNKQSGSNLNLALIPRNGNGFTKSNLEMPVYNPNFRSKMPIMKPDSTIKYHMPIKRFSR